MQALLTDPDLGDLELGCDPFVVEAIQIGSPKVRDVVRDRALADGTFDQTRYLGARAITVTTRINDQSCDGTAECMQAHIDRIVPFMHPRRRPTLAWQLPGCSDVRGAIVRGDNWPIAVSAPKYPALVVSFVVPSGEIFGANIAGELAETCVTISPSSDSEDGRHYGEDPTTIQPATAAPFAEDEYGPYFTNSTGLVERAYAPSSPIGARTIINHGNTWAHWTATIFGDITNPTLTVNRIPIRFDQAGGLDLPVAQSVQLDTRNRTILLNASATDSRYDRANYDEWAWSDVLLAPGRNQIRLGGDTVGASATAVICYRPTFIG